MRNENLKLRTDLQYQSNDGWTTMQQMMIIGNTLLKFPKKDLQIESQGQSRQCSFQHNFHTLLFSVGCELLVVIDSISYQTGRLSSGVCAPPFGAAVLFNWILSRHLFLKNIDLIQLLCTGLNQEHAVLFLCLILNQKPMNDLKLEQAMSAALVSNEFLLNPSKFHSSWENKSIITTQKLQAF